MRACLASICAQLAAIDFCSADTIAVLYPEIREPYNQVFLRIAKGIAQQNQDDTLKYALKKQINSDKLNVWLGVNRIEGVIALGSRSLQVLPSLPAHLPVVVGAVTARSDQRPNPNGKSLLGVSLTPSPRLLFIQLQRFKPKVSTVYVVGLLDFDKGLIAQAEQDAASLNIKLKFMPAPDLQQAAQHYRGIIASINPNTDAIWLAQSGRQLGRAVLNEVLESAWVRNFVVFSSHIADVKRGVFFALYPNNHLMGGRLAMLLQNRQPNDIEPTHWLFVENLQLAVNLRTADHIGLHFGTEDMLEFDFMYPPP